MSERGPDPTSTRTPEKPSKDGNGKDGTDPKDAGKESATLWLRVFLLSLLCALLASNLLLPWKLVGLALALFAFAAGITTLVKAVRAKMSRFVVLLVSLGVVTAAFLGVGAIASVALWPVTAQYEDCMSRALTLQAERTCQDELRDLGGLLGPGSGR